MRIDELTVEVRDASLARVGQILPKDLVGFKAVLRFNNVGSWEITLPNGHEVGETLRLPGSGIVVTGPNGVILSGPTTGATNTKTAENPNGDWTIQGADDSIVLGERLAYPTPSVADVSAQTDANDARTGIASTVMFGYVDDNIGPNAPVEREIPGLALGTDSGLGSTVYPSARFDVLGELLSGIASIDGLGFDIKQVDGTLEFNVFQPVDRSGYIRMDVANNTLSKTEYAYGSHALSRAIVAGGGEGVTRTFLEVTSTDSLAAEDAWNRRIESFIDQRNTTDANELTQAGNEKLADGGATLTSVDVVPSSDMTMAYGSDWDLGDIVTVVVDDQEVSATVTTVSMSVGSDGVRVGATVGQPTGVDFQSVTARKTTQTAQRVNALERKEGGGGGAGGPAGLITQDVKNDQGASVTKGQAVYVSGANGTNVLVKLAKADAELTSSKTIGLLSQDLATNGLGTIVTEGFLAGLDTSSATAGDTVWLSATTAGGLVFGTANRPVTPNHMVFIGWVLRSNNVNGEIFVKIQNGFENDELHDRLTFVGDTAPSSPKDYYYWFNTSDGSLSFRYNDGDSSQWVQISSGTIADAALTSRVTAVEGRTTTLENTKAPLASPSFTGNVSIGANLTVTGETYLNGTEIQGDGKTILRFSDTWLRINEDNDFSSGIYAGSGILRTDGNLQVGSSGSVLDVTSSAFNYNGLPASGLVPVKPSSVYGATSSISATGRVSVTSGTGFYLNGIFTNKYRNYKIIIDNRNMGGSYQYFRFCYSDNNMTTIGAYYGGGFYRQGSSTGIWSGTGDGYSYGSIGYTADGGHTVIDIMSPQWNGSYGKVIYHNSYGAGNHTQVWGDWMWNGFDAFSGIYIYNSGANYYAEVEVYGYNH